MKRSRQTALLALAMSAICWGLAPVANRYLVGQIAPFPLTAIRYVLTAILLSPALFVRRSTAIGGGNHDEDFVRGTRSMGVRIHSGARKDIWLYVLCTLTGIVGYNLCVTFAVQSAPAEFVGLLTGTEPLWIGVFAIFVSRYPLTRSFLWGTLLCVTGIVVIFVGAFHMHASQYMTPTALGLVLPVVGAMLWGIYSLAIRPLSIRHGALASSARAVFMGTVLLVLPALGTIGHALLALRVTDWLVISLWSTFNAAAFVLWNYGMARVAPSIGAVFLYLIPVISVGGGIMLLGEPVDVWVVCGGVAIIVGVYVTSKAPESVEIPHEA